MRKLKKLLIILMSIVILSAFVFWKYMYYPKIAEDIKLNEKIKSTVSTSNTIDFRDITDFDWDNMIIIPPYGIPKDILKEHNIKRANINRSIEVSDSINMIIFTNREQIISYVNYKRNDGDFDIQRDTQFKKDTAIFDIIKTNQQIKLVQKLH